MLGEQRQNFINRNYRNDRWRKTANNKKLAQFTENNHLGIKFLKTYLKSKRNTPRVQEYERVLRCRGWSWENATRRHPKHQHPTTHHTIVNDIINILVHDAIIIVIRVVWWQWCSAWTAAGVNKTFILQRRRFVQLLGELGVAAVDVDVIDMELELDKSESSWSIC
jgi:hypothetical protein